jgi:hypothetical protein
MSAYNKNTAASVDEFSGLFNRLVKVNDDLLTVMKTKNTEVLSPLLDEREKLSNTLEEIVKKVNLNQIELSEDLKLLTKKIIDQDSELMIYLELELQKLRGKHKINQMKSQQNFIL